MELVYSCIHSSTEAEQLTISATPISYSLLALLLLYQLLLLCYISFQFSLYHILHFTYIIQLPLPHRTYYIKSQCIIPVFTLVYIISYCTIPANATQCQISHLIFTVYCAVHQRVSTTGPAYINVAGSCSQTMSSNVFQCISMYQRSCLKTTIFLGSWTFYFISIKLLYIIIF